MCHFHRNRVSRPPHTFFLLVLVTVVPFASHVRCGAGPVHVVDAWHAVCSRAHAQGVRTPRLSVACGFYLSHASPAPSGHVRCDWLWSTVADDDVGATQQMRAANMAADHQIVDIQPDLHGPVKVARGHGFIRARAEDVLNMLIAVERRPEWDDLCDYASKVCDSRFPRAGCYPVRVCSLCGGR